MGPKFFIILITFIFPIIFTVTAGAQKPKDDRPYFFYTIWTEGTRLSQPVLVRLNEIGKERRELQNKTLMVFRRGNQAWLPEGKEGPVVFTRGKQHILSYGMFSPELMTEIRNALRTTSGSFVGIKVVPIARKDVVFRVFESGAKEYSPPVDVPFESVDKPLAVLGQLKLSEQLVSLSREQSRLYRNPPKRPFWAGPDFDEYLKDAPGLEKVLNAFRPFEDNRLAIVHVTFSIMRDETWFEDGRYQTRRVEQHTAHLKSYMFYTGEIRSGK